MILYGEDDDDDYALIVLNYVPKVLIATVE